MLAIVIPYYNYSFFEQTLNSLSKQTNKNFKVYIGDDASPDNPSSVVENYKEELDIHYQRFNENLGGKSLTKQWDRCIALTNREEWLMLLADDDFLDPSVIENWYKHIDIFGKKSNVIRFASQIIYEESRKKSLIYKHPEWEGAIKSFYRKYNNLSRSSLSEHIFRESTYQKIGFHNFELAWHSDDMAWIEFSDRKPIYTINNSIVYIRLSQSSISGKEDNLELKRKASIRFYKLIIKNKLDFFDKDQRFQLLRRYEDLLISCEKIRFINWIFLLKFYLVYFELYNFKKFLKRFLKSYLQSQ